MTAHISDHVARRLARLAMMYRESKSHQGVLVALTKQIQALEDAAFGLLVLRSISDATASQLDEIAKILNVEREGRTDASLRIRLRAQVLVNSRSGEFDTLLRVLRLLAPTGASVGMTEFYPASLVARVAGGALPEPASVGAVLRLAKAAGVNVQLVYQTTDDTGTFTLSDAGGASTGGQGLGDTNNATTGGQLAGVV